MKKMIWLRLRRGLSLELFRHLQQHIIRIFKFFSYKKAKIHTWNKVKLCMKALILTEIFSAINKNEQLLIVNQYKR